MQLSCRHQNSLPLQYNWLTDNKSIVFVQNIDIGIPVIHSGMSINDLKVITSMRLKGEKIYVNINSSCTHNRNYYDGHGNRNSLKHDMAFIPLKVEDLWSYRNNQENEKECFAHNSISADYRYSPELEFKPHTANLNYGFIPQSESINTAPCSLVKPLSCMNNTKDLSTVIQNSVSPTNTVF